VTQMNAPRVRIQLDFDAVNWPGVLKILSGRFKLSFLAADRELKDFVRRFLRPFNLYWYLHPHLSEQDNRLLMVVCECHGADVVVLSFRRALHIGALEIQYMQEIEFVPRFRQAEPGAGLCRPRIEVRFLGLRVVLGRLWSALCFQAACFVFAVLLYVLGMGLMLYGLAVFLLFLHLPLPVTLAATKQAPLGLALLCFLTGLAAISGRAVRNVFGLLWEKWRRLRGQR